MNAPNKNVGDANMVRSRLKEVMTERGLRQDWLAKKTGIHQANISRLVNGKSFPTLDVAHRIANVLGMRIDEIWPWKENGE